MGFEKVVKTKYKRSISLSVEGGLLKGSFCRYRSTDYVKQKKQGQKTKQLQIKTSPK